MKRTKHKILSVFLSFCMIISCMVGMTVTASADDPLEWTNGNVIATLDGTKLTVEKKPNTDGAMDDNDWTAVGSAPAWDEKRATITEVEIQDGVTSIGRNAFPFCKALTSVDIPSTVTSIGRNAFQYCRALTSVTIPSSVTSIGLGAFKGCDALTSVTIPSGVTSIGGEVFDGCSALTTVTIPDSVESMGSSVFGGCHALTSVTILGSVTSIGVAAFESCYSLTSVTIPGSVTSIGMSAFEGCSSLTSVTIPSKVASIGKRAFQNCLNLATVTFERVSNTDAIAGKSLEIGQNAFNGTKPGATVAYGTGSTVLNDGTNDITTDTPLTDIQNKNLTWIAPNAKAWENVNVIGVLETEGDVKKLNVVKKAGATDGNMGTAGWTAVGSAGPWTEIKESITAVEIQDGVTSIGNVAFLNCTDLTSVTIPSSVKSIGNNAFSGCSKLTSVDVPNSVTSIGGGAFEGCSALTSVTIPGSVTSIDGNTFNGCSDLTSVTIPSGVTSIGGGAFYKCTSLTSVTIPGSVTSIGYEAFKDCTALTRVTFIPGTADAALLICEAAFTGTGASLAYGAGSTVLYDGTNPINAGDALTKIYSTTGEKTLTWKAVAVTDVTLDKATAEIEVGKTETLTATVKPDNAADKTVTWTSSDESVATVANGVVTAVAAGTATITAKAGDKTATCTVTVKSVSPEPEPAPTPEPTPTPDPTPYMPTFIPTPAADTPVVTTPTVDITNCNIEGKQNENALKWDSIPNASAYSLYVKVDDNYVFVQDLGNVTKVDVVRSTSGKYYVSTGGSYVIYKYDKKTGTFTNTGKLKADKIDSIKKANNVTEDFMVKYYVNGKESTENNSYKVSVNTYYKPAVMLTASKGSITAKWAKVPGAQKYKVFKVVNGKLIRVTEIHKNTIRITGTTAGKKYSYVVKAFVNGKWTKAYKSDIVSVTAK